ncbi:MAG: family 16 glycosylhydrolase, partial [Coprobacillus cateniformis]
NRKVIYNSGSVRTHGKKEFLYGRIEMKAKLPKGQGVFPAFWTLGSDFVLDGDINSQQGYGWARCGEIDIMELIGQAGDNSYGNRTVYQTAHTDNNRVTETKLAGTAYTIGENFNNEYHVFGIDWSPNKIEWYVDDEIVQSVDYSHLPIAQKALNRPQYIQMNLAMGGNWPGDVGTGLAGTEFDIDYVYYGQNASQKAAAKAYYETAPHMTGLQNITMVEGEIPDLLKNISVTEGYHVDFSIDDEYMFQSHGGRTECSLRCKGKDDAATLATLPAGKYNIHYTAIPDEVEFETDQWDSSLLVPLAEKEYKFDRKTMILTIVKAE